MLSHNIIRLTELLSSLLEQIKSPEYETEPAIAAMHGPHSVFDIGHGTVIYCDAGDVSLVDQ